MPRWFKVNKAKDYKNIQCPKQLKVLMDNEMIVDTVTVSYTKYNWNKP